MAIIMEGKTPCAICGETDLNRPFTATSGCAFPPSDELWRFCDAPLHLDCLAGWDQRVRFSRAYFDMWREAARNGMGLVLREGNGWMLRCGPSMPGEAPYYAEIDLVEWPIRLYSRWNDWTESLSGGFVRELVGPALHAVERAIAEVRAIAPDARTLAALRQQALSAAVSAAVPKAT